MSTEIIEQENTTSEQGLSLREYLSVCLGKWYWILLSVVIFLTCAWFYLKTTPPMYTRSAQLLVKTDSKGSKSTFGDGLSNFDLFQSKANINNEVAILKSPDLMAEIVRKLNLNTEYMVEDTWYRKLLYGKESPINVVFNHETPGKIEFELKLGEDSAVNISKIKINGLKVESKPIDGRLNDFIDTPMGMLMVQPAYDYSDSTSWDKPIEVIRMPVGVSAAKFCGEISIKQEDAKSSVLSLQITDLSRQRAVDILNALITEYNNQWIDDRNQIAISTSNFIDERLAVIEKELGNVDANISSYKSSNLLPDLKAASNMYMQQANDANAEIMRLNNQLYMAQYVRKYLVDNSTMYQLLPVNSGFENNAIASQISQYNTKLLERNNLVANSSDSNPIVKDMDNSLGEMRKAIVSSIDNQIENLKSNINAQKKFESNAINQIASNPQQAKYLLSVERQQKVKESLYLFLLQKREENELSQAFTAFNTRVVVKPNGSSVPSSPNKRMTWLIALAIGIALPMLIIYLYEMMYTKVRGRADLEKLKMPLVGEVPQDNPVSAMRKFLQFMHIVKPQVQDAVVAVKPGNRNVINEAFRVVRANLEFIKGDHKVIAIVSANPGSGKTFLTYNIAKSFAIKEKKVITVDLDLRKGSQSKYVGSPRLGIVDYIVGKVTDLDSIIVHKGDMDPDVLPMGTMPPNPTELLYSPRLAEVINTLRERYDLIFLDCPPIEIVADSAIINKEADMTLFVIRAGIFERGMIPEINSFYETGRYKNMAALLNGTESHGGYGARYGYKYGYRYGYHSTTYGGYANEK